MSIIVQIIKRKAIKFLSSIYDPLVTLKIGNQSIKIPFSHPLKENISSLKDYNYNLPRIIKYVSDEIKGIKIIDIGANIGDTVAFIKNYTDLPILCIDGDEKYINILKQNVAKYKNVSVCHSLVGAETAEIKATLKTENGTGILLQSKEKNYVRSIEDILQEYHDFKNSKIIKIDTDGFDTLILKGCKSYLIHYHPILFFEFVPDLAINNNDDPFTIVPYLKECGYKYLMFYMSNGEYLVSCDIEKDEHIIIELIHYFSGRNIALYTDICAFPEQDKRLFDICVKEEIEHFKKARNY